MFSYTSTNGVYVSVKPTPLSKDMIARLQAFGSHNEPPEEFHATIIYSKTSVPIDAAQAVLEASPERYPAMAIGCTAWPGHDGDGYIVLLLKSPALEAENRILHSLGATSNFDEYRPHVTLAKNLDIEAFRKQVQSIDSRLKTSPLPLTFFNLSIQDLKN